MYVVNSYDRHCSILATLDLPLFRELGQRYWLLGWLGCWESATRVKGLSRLGDSNPGPMVYETIALPLS